MDVGMEGVGFYAECAEGAVEGGVWHRMREVLS